MDFPLRCAIHWTWLRVLSRQRDDKVKDVKLNWINESLKSFWKFQGTPRINESGMSCSKPLSTSHHHPSFCQLQLIKFYFLFLSFFSPESSFCRTQIDLLNALRCMGLWYCLGEVYCCSTCNCGNHEIKIVFRDIALRAMKFTGISEQVDLLAQNQKKMAPSWP